MIPKRCKRLAEVDFSIAEVSRHAVRLLPVAERAKALFGEDGAATAANPS